MELYHRLAIMRPSMRHVSSKTLHADIGAVVTVTLAKQDLVSEKSLYKMKKKYCE